MIKNGFLTFEVGLLKVLFLRMAGLLGFCFRGCAGSCFGLSAQFCSNTPYILTGIGAVIPTREPKTFPAIKSRIARHASRNIVNMSKPRHTPNQTIPADPYLCFLLKVLSNHSSPVLYFLFLKKSASPAHNHGIPKIPSQAWTLPSPLRSALRS